MSSCEGRTRILYLTAGFPFPLSSGYLRHFHLLRELACNHYIHLMSLTGPTFLPDHTEGLSGFVDRVSTFTKPPTTRIQRVSQLLDPVRPGPAAQAMALAVDDEIAAGDVDVVLLSGKDTAAIASVVDGRVPLVVDLCDATSYRISQAIRLAKPAKRAGLAVRRRGVRAIEHELVCQADSLITASERDRTALHDEGAPARVLDAEVIPNGVDLDYWHRTSDVLGGAVVFCGNLGYGPNADAARRLVLDVMPLVWERRPGTEAVIIGTGAPEALVEALDHPHVTVTGSVPDVRPHLERGAVFAAPLRVASGIQNKLLEALAMELPVVTTTVAAAGLRTGGARPPLDVADLPADQADAIVDLLPEPGASDHRPHRIGRAWVAERFSWDRSGATLGTIVDELHQQERASC
jgi:glycosyltransferase involved in cell wall biosynthesis